MLIHLMPVAFQLVATGLDAADPLKDRQMSLSFGYLTKKCTYFLDIAFYL